ncbi:MAG: SpoIID/LytB domain-containing protein [Chitinivibrionales bacterium]|nr:SpoIID/LytB domain-containing protein [Chitinivibrionales bacterium]
MTRPRSFRIMGACLVRVKSVCCLLACLPLACKTILVPNPPGQRAAQPVSRPPVARPAPSDTVPPAPCGADTLDFATAFVRPPHARPQSPAGVQTRGRTDARVILVRAAGSIRLTLPAQWSARTPRGRSRFGGGGAVRASRFKGTHTASFVLAPRRSVTLWLPCTLQTAQPDQHIGVDSLMYRGALIVAPEGAESLCAVNLVPMEEYLRGVVPLEMGSRGEELIEALKVQAVAARTYAYRKMLMRAGSHYDLAATVADQVYGGVLAENPVADRAVKETNGLVLMYDGQPIVAYYHSTCGGRTAAVEQVWDKPAEPYLRSVSDLDPNGVPWCAASRYTRWTYTWQRDQLSSYVTKYGQSVGCGGRFDGRLEKMSIVSRWPCGRVQRVRVVGRQGTGDFCGDKVRFALRRPQQNLPILPSARFDIVRQDGNGITVRGSGYGHGVGMCQMGALGRAGAGQGFAQILAAYYTGARLHRVGSVAQARH